MCEASHQDDGSETSSAEPPTRPDANRSVPDGQRRFEIVSNTGCVDLGDQLSPPPKRVRFLVPGSWFLVAGFRFGGVP